MAHKPTEKLKEYVRGAARARESKSSIARTIGIGRDTFDKHYGELYAEARHEIPNLAQNVIYEFLGDNFDSLSENGKKIMRKEQAQLAEKVMRSHGWKQGYEIEGVKELPPINITVLPKNSEDEE